MLVSLLLFLIASILNAFMDTIWDHFPQSIFKNLNTSFWAPQISWAKCKTIFGYHIDAWHIAKSLMIILLICSILSFDFAQFKIQYKIIIFFIYGISWNIVFNLFYSKILIQK